MECQNNSRWQQFRLVTSSQCLKYFGLKNTLNGNESQGRFCTRFPEYQIYYLDTLPQDIINKKFCRIMDKKQYELKDHLGNVRMVIGDIKLPDDEVTSTRGVPPFFVDEKAANDYYPFGMLMTDRNWSLSNYRYGYNSQEMTREINGDGNHTTAEFWEYDPRSARRWNQDPKPTVGLSNYATFGNNPNMYIDVLGDSSVWDNRGYMIYYDKNDKDLRVFMQSGDKLTLLGELGKTIDANIWFKNMLHENSIQADEIFNPFAFKDLVAKDGYWDYKSRSEGNQQNKNIYKHLLGVAFFRSDKEYGSNDLPVTTFLFQNDKLRSEDLNNFHYGVVGKSAGYFGETILEMMAGWNEIDKNSHNNSNNNNSSFFQVLKNKIIRPFGDKEIDNYWIRKGMQYYDKNRKTLDEDLW